MEHWCRCGPGGVRLLRSAGRLGSPERAWPGPGARGGEPGGAMMHPRSPGPQHPEPARRNHTNCADADPARRLTIEATIQL